ncbi:MAG: hypothetical protein ACOZF2_05875 [Thermodesulfobacteriota bacterium]
MPKITFDMIKTVWGLRFYEAMQAIWHTRAFQQFCQTDREQVIKDLRDRLKTFSQKPKNAREKYEQEWLELPFEEALEEALKSAFLETLKAQQVMSRLEGLDAHKTAIYCERKLFDEKYISLRIDLTYPKERLRAEFESILSEWHHCVERPSTPRRGAAVMDTDEIERMFQAYALVEEHLAQEEGVHQSVLQATIKLYTKKRRPSLKNPPASDKVLYQEAPPTP